MDLRKICQSLDRTGEIHVAVFGDFCLDKYLRIDPQRDEPSVETGLTAYQIHEKRLYPGAGGTVTANLRALGARVTCLGLVGDDGEGYELCRCLKKIGVNTDLMIRSEKVCTNTYTKPVRLQSDGSWQELNRLDFRNFTPTPKELTDRLLENLERVLPEVNAVILLDQFPQRNMGVITDEVRHRLGELAKAHPEVIFYADSRAFIREFRNTIVKCNNFELMGDKGKANNMFLLLPAAAELHQTTGGPVTYITMGKSGVLVMTHGQLICIPAFPVEGPVDICGAGDATTAGIVLGLALGLDPFEAAALGCCIASITIKQIGVTGTATIEQIRKRLKLPEKGAK